MRQPKETDGSLWFHFSKTELEQAAAPFCFSVVLKFLKRRPTLDQIRIIIKSRWEIKGFFSVSTMQRPRNGFIRFATEEDFGITCARESSDIEGAPYRLSIWSQDFDENQESPLIPVWIFLPGLSPHFYHKSMLRIITGAFGCFLKRDNFTACASRTDGVRVCVEIDISKPLVESFWLGVPFHPSSRHQEIVYEKLPFYCHWCKRQGHLQSQCQKMKETAGTDKSEAPRKAPRKMWRRKEDGIGSASEKTDQMAEQDTKIEEKRKRLQQRETVFPSAITMFVCNNGRIFKTLDETSNLNEGENSQPIITEMVEINMSENNTNNAGSKNVGLRSETTEFMEEFNGLEEDVLEQAILRGDADVVQDVLVMDIMENIAELVIKGQPLPQMPENMDNLQEERQTMETQNTSEGFCIQALDPPFYTFDSSCTISHETIRESK